MRVIGGEFRSRVLKSLAGMDVRPTTDRLRETLFDVLAPRIEGVRFADLYAGTGAVGIEALSRGAVSVTFIEQNRKAADLIRMNLKSLGVEARARVIHAPISKVFDQIDAEIIFLDPPYHLETEYERTLTRLTAGFVIAQHAARFVLKDSYGTLHLTRILKQGDNALSFYQLS